ncbi:hypothetical protein CRYO30217_00556 [Parvicella tangerina]|uniref:Exo-alpha-sialidase n=2 Tax=Parvicella tangerina TaxID=2829795 RepID=A0A916JJZ4_9FLAO|nr:hypothetical protein CRYO30217_00556 [Parvicella tangerina]
MGCAENTDHTASTKKGSESPEQQELNLTVTHSFVTDTNEHYRGLEIHDKVAVIGGSQGNILVYDFKLDSLRIFFTAEGIHIRDIDKISDGSHTALGITQPAQILFRDMPSDSFIVVFEGKDSLMFLDGIDFWENEYGIAFGDPIDGYPLVLFRELYDKTWSRVKEVDFPKEASNYAGFAASGTSIKCLPNGVAIIGLGNETAKVLRTPDYGMTWDLIDVPFHKEPNGTGIYSMAFKDSLNGVAVGGHWQNVTCDSSKIYTTDGGLSWHLSEGVQEYRSCVTYYKDDVYISTGTTGTDISYDGGKSWQLLDTIGYNAIAFQKDGTGIAVGSYGRITLLELK